MSHKYLTLIPFRPKFTSHKFMYLEFLSQRLHPK